MEVPLSGGPGIGQGKIGGRGDAADRTGDPEELLYLTVLGWNTIFQVYRF
jgi:hypothetical protein